MIDSSHAADRATLSATRDGEDKAPMDQVDCPTSPLLRTAVERFVAAADIERVNQTGGPFSLVIKVLPFLEDLPSAERAAWLPLNRVVGESWRWTTPEPRPGQEDLAQYLLSPTRADRSERDAAIAWWLPQLGLGVMHEGKNRVGYLRDACGATYMPASITLMHFPSAERLQLWEAELGPGRFYALVLDGRWLTVLAHPDLSLPLLRAYGIHPQPWQSSLPPLWRLLSSPAWKPHAFWTHAIDLESMRQPRRQHAAIVAGSFMDVADLRPHWPGIKSAVTTVVAASVLAGILFALKPLGALSFGAMVAMALVGGAVMALTSSVAQGPRTLWHPGHQADGAHGNEADGAD